MVGWYMLLVFLAPAEGIASLPIRFEHDILGVGSRMDPGTPTVSL